jgi:hypothetical protein
MKSNKLFSNLVPNVSFFDLPCEIPERGGEAAFPRVNKVDPLIYPKCSGEIKVISAIEDGKGIRLMIYRISGTRIHKGPYSFPL